MLTPEEILKLAENKAVEYRKWENESKSGKKDLPDFTPVYRDTVEMAEHIAIHAEKNTFPRALFQKKRPNESDLQFEYLELNYKAVTIPYWNRASNVFGRIFNKQNYQIDWKEDKEDAIYKDESARKYFLEGFPGHKSILSYFESIARVRKTNDPNSVRCVKPYFIPTKKNDAEEDVLDDTQLINTFSVIYSASQVLDFKEDSHCLILLNEKSEVQFGNSTEQTGLIFEYYDKNEIWHIVQIGKKVDNKFEPKLFYSHNLNELPVEKLKGIPIQLEKEVYYKSILYNALPSLDTALVHAQTLEAAIIANAFPQYWEYVDKCAGTQEDGPCDNGWFGFGDEKRKCTECKGTGKTNKRSVLGKIEIIPQDRLNENDANISIPPAGYIEQNTHILDFLDVYVEKKCTQAFSMINIDVSESYVKGSETALGKQIDREELFATILTFSNELFDLLKSTIRLCGLMRYGPKFNMPAIYPPVDFAIRSEYDLTEELGKAKENNVPKAALRYIIKQYIRQRCNDEVLIKREDLRFSVDSLATEDTLTIIAGVGAGLIPKWKYILHDEFDIYLDLILLEDKDFLDKKLPEQRAELIKRAKTEAKEISSPKTAEKIVEEL